MQRWWRLLILGSRRSIRQGKYSSLQPRSMRQNVCSRPKTFRLSTGESGRRKCNNNRRAGLQSGIRGPTQVSFCPDSDLISNNQRVGGSVMCGGGGALSSAEQTRERWSIESRADAASATQSYQRLNRINRIVSCPPSSLNGYRDGGRAPTRFGAITHA
jgi:hypothetical protein